MLTDFIVSNILHKYLKLLKRKGYSSFNTKCFTLPPKENKVFFTA